MVPALILSYIRIFFLLPLSRVLDANELNALSLSFGSHSSDSEGHFDTPEAATPVRTLPNSPGELENSNAGLDKPGDAPAEQTGDAEEIIWRWASILLQMGSWKLEMCSLIIFTEIILIAKTRVNTNACLFSQDKTSKNGSEKSFLCLNNYLKNTQECKYQHHLARVIGYMQHVWLIQECT